MLKRILIYCRESRDEDGTQFERIETQRDILLRFVQEQGLEGKIEIILDDNVSGTNFERLRGIAEQAEAGLLDVLVFKDASRLGRNLRESLNFLHRMELCGVDVLFESESYDPELFPLLAWFNERRAAEDSRKVKRVFEHKQKTGELLFRPPYGYRKEGHSLLIDTICADVVRRVFAAYLSGESTGEIAETLNRDQIPTPSTQPGRRLARGRALWNRQHIRRILADRAYLGEMCYQKTTKPSYQRKQIQRNHPERWLVLTHHHEAIIDPSSFRQAADLASRAQKNNTAGRKLCFSGILYCGGCGAKLVQRRRKDRAECYVCASYQQRGTAACKSHFIREDALLNLARIIAEPLLQHETLHEGLMRSLGGQQPDAHTARLIEQYERSLLRIYDDMLERPEMMPSMLYERKLEDYTARLNAAKAAVRQQEAIDPESLATWLSTGDVLSERAVLHRLFSRVTFYLPGEADCTASNCQKGMLVFTAR